MQDNHTFPETQPSLHCFYAVLSRRSVSCTASSGSLICQKRLCGSASCFTFWRGSCCQVGPSGLTCLMKKRCAHLYFNSSLHHCPSINAAAGMPRNMHAHVLPQILAPEQQALADVPAGDLPLKLQRSECQPAVKSPFGITIKISTPSVRATP